MNKKFLFQTIIALGIVLPIVPASHAQCTSCAPDVKWGYSPGTPMKIYLDPSLSQAQYDAAVNAINSWNG